VLVVGGGTGWILDEVSKLNRKNISIVYVEKSSKMIELSKKRKHENVAVEFVCSGIERYKTDEHFDVILTPFVFDNFIEKKIQYVFQRLDALLHQRGFWLYADFVNYQEVQRAWKQYFLKTMYIFFSLAANIETKKLIDMRPYFTEKYKMVTQQFYYRRFIESIVYRKIK
jgi:ubiquinone/menaquinone biosynthesis C-methylase UbiE